MKGFLIFTVLFATLCVLCSGDDCVFMNHQFNVSQTYQPPDVCAQYTCDQPGLVTGKPCAPEFGMEPCKFIAEDLSKPYPDCCPRFVNC